MLAKKTKAISLKSFDIASVLAIFLSIVMTFSFTVQEQNNSAVHVIQLLQANEQYAEHEKPYINFNHFIGIANIAYIHTSDSRFDVELTIKATNLSTFTRTVVKVLPQQNISITFIHPFLVMLSSVVFISSIALLTLGLLFLRRRFSNRLTEQLTPINDLESWVNGNTIAKKTQPLVIRNKRADDNNHNAIADAIISIQLALEKAQQDKNLFDQELRENVLLDPTTRIGTQDFFKSHLAALLLEEDARGAVFLVQLKGCELIQNLYGETQAIHLLETAIDSIKSRIFNIADCFLSRRGEFELAILVPDLYVDEMEKLAERLLKNLMTLSLPIGISKDEFCHVGISYFKSGSKLYKVMSEADMALRSAQLQGPSQWFMYDPGEVAKETAIGSLKWRTFLTHVISNKAFVTFSQQVISNDNNQVLSYEILSKIKNSRGELISPRIFLPMAEKCGLSLALDFMVFEQVCEQIKTDQYTNIYSINFSLDALLSEKFRERFLATLTETPKLIPHLILEISEYHLKSRKNELLPTLNIFKEYGLLLLADKVGQYIVNAKYLNECHISFVKLHRSIVLDIHKKPENQVFVQSMKVLCEPLNIQLFAVGVESIDEWLTLQKIGIDGGQGHFFDEPIPKIVNRRK